MIKPSKTEKKYCILLLIAIVGIIYGWLPATINIRGFIEILPIALSEIPNILAFWLNKFFNILFIYSLFMLLFITVKES